MSFKIISTPVFEKELKKISAKYPSFKSDYRHFLDSLADNPTQGISLGIIVTKYVWQLPVKKKEKAEEQD